MNRLTELSWIVSAYHNIRTDLENERRRVQQEIVTYPSPITACDQQFNYLLEERSRISQELTCLHEAFEEGQQSDDPVKLLDEFVRSSGCLDDETKQALGRYLSERHSEVPTRCDS